MEHCYSVQCLEEIEVNNVACYCFSLFICSVTKVMNVCIMRVETKYSQQKLSTVVRPVKIHFEQNKIFKLDGQLRFMNWQYGWWCGRNWFNSVCSVDVIVWTVVPEIQRFVSSKSDAFRGLVTHNCAYWVYSLQNYKHKCSMKLCAYKLNCGTV